MKQVHLELAHMTRDEVAEYAADSILVLPTAATEQHGPHLPLGTDAIIGEAVAREALRVADIDHQLILAPVMPYGSSHHHLIYNALSLSTATYLAGISDLLDTALTSGFRRVYVLNSHGGNVDCVRLAARDTALVQCAVVGSCSYWDVSLPAILKAGLDGKAPVPGHAGQFETSLMLAIRPDLVRMERLKAITQHTPVQAGLTTPGSIIQAHGDWGRMEGVTDIPNAPSSDLGRRLLEVIGTSVAAAIAEFDEVSMRSLQEEA